MVFGARGAERGGEARGCKREIDGVGESEEGRGAEKRRAARCPPTIVRITKLRRDFTLFRRRA